MRITHTHEHLIERGFVRLGEQPEPEMPTFGRMRQVHIAHDVKWHGITSFRLAEGWVFYQRSDAEKGFVDVPMMPEARQ